MTTVNLVIEWGLAAFIWTLVLAALTAIGFLLYTLFGR